MHFDEMIAWKPMCEIDGSFSAKQCRGDKLTGRFFILFLKQHTKISSNNVIKFPDVFVMLKRVRKFSDGIGLETLIK
jgi:hypothetical protein